MKNRKRMQFLVGSSFALAAALIASFIPRWLAMECGSWECRFPQHNFWKATASFFAPQNQPEALDALPSVLLPELLVLLTIALFGFVIGFVLARLWRSPNKSFKADT